MANDNGPITAVVLGSESTYATETTAYHQIFADGKPNIQDVFVRKLIRVQNGTYTGSTIKALLQRHTTLQMKVPLMFDQAGYIFTHIFGFPATTSLGSGAYRHQWLFPQPVSATSWASASAMVYNNIYWRKILGGRVARAQFDFSSTDVPMLDVTYLFQASSGNDSTAEPTYNVPNAFNALGSRLLQVNLNDVSAELIKGQVTFDNKLVPFWTARRSANMKRQKRNGLADLGFDFTLDWEDYADSPKEAYDTETDLGRLDAEWLSEEEVISTSALNPRLLITAKNLLIENAEEAEDQGESAVQCTGQGAYVVGPPAAMGSIVLENNIASYAGDA